MAIKLQAKPTDDREWSGCSQASVTRVLSPLQCSQGQGRLKLQAQQSPALINSEAADNSLRQG